MNLRYAPSEMTLPEGIGPDHLDWIGFSWDLTSSTVDKRGHKSFVQYIVLPGLVVNRRGPLNKSTWHRTKTEWEYGFSTRTADQLAFSPMHTAIGSTNKLLREGFEWTTSPYLFSIDEKDCPHWPPAYRYRERGSLTMSTYYVDTIGDAFHHGDGMMRREILNAALTERRKHH